MATLEELGQKIKAKYPQYASMSDVDVAQKVITKYPQYQKQIDSPSIEQPQPKPTGGPTFQAEMGGAETIPGNIARTFGNIPSSAMNLGRALIAPVNPFDTESPLNIGANLVKSGEALGQVFKSKTPLKDIGEGFVQTGKDIGGAVARFGKQAVEDPSSVAKLGIEDPLLVPSLLYAPSRALGTKTLGTKALDVATKPVKKVGELIEKPALVSMERTKGKFLQELVSPELTKNVKQDRVSRTTETGVGPFMRSVVAPTTDEVRMAREVAKIPEVKEGRSFQQNYNAIYNYNIKEAQRLENSVAANDFIIPRTEVAAKLNATRQTLEQSPTIVGDAQTTANKLISGAVRILNENPGTGSGLLRARKEYDQWVLSQKPKAFDGATENAFTLANREVRNVLNDTLDKYAPSVGVKDSLSNQAALYRALDNIEVKAAKEADTTIGRVFDRVGNALQTRSRVVQGLGLVTGVGVLGTAMMYALPYTIGAGIGYVLYRGGKLFVSPEARAIVGRILKDGGDVIQPRDKRFLEQLLLPVVPVENLLKEDKGPIFRGKTSPTSQP